MAWRRFEAEPTVSQVPVVPDAVTPGDDGLWRIFFRAFAVVPGCVSAA